MAWISERTVTIYRGFKIVAGKGGGGFRAVGHCRFAGRLDVAGKSVAQAIDVCTTEVDRVLSENGAAIQERLITGHAAWLRAQGRPYAGVRVPGTRYYHRVSHCYACKTTVDNSYDLECAGCGWIICGHCGACGCRG